MNTIMIIFLFCSLSVNLATAATKYILEDISFGNNCVPSVINDLGQVAGEYQAQIGYYKFFFWDPQTGGQDMGFNPETYLDITGINNVGQVVGQWGADGFVWDEMQGTRWLPKLTYESWACCLPQDINDFGCIVGGATTQSGSGTAAWWDPQGNIHSLGVHGYQWTDSYGINNRGEIVGNANLNGIINLLLWDERGSLRDLGIPPGLFRVEPRAITESSRIAGWIEAPLNRTRYAFLWDEASGFQLFLGTGENSHAYDMNYRGQIVGERGYKGYVWQDGHVGDLASLTENMNGGSIHTAYGINNYGLICAYGRLKSGLPRAFLLHPVLQVAIDIRPDEPEPAPVNLKSHGKLPVALYGSTEVDVSTLLPETLTLAEAPCLSGQLTDVNGDGIEDLLLHFSTQALQLGAGAPQVRLDGRTVHGQFIRGYGYVKVVGR